MDEQTLQILDTFAQQFIAMNEPLQFKLAESQAEREAAFRLRYEETIGRGWGKPEDYPNGLEQDEHDEQASQIVVWDGENLAATARLVFPIPDKPLPIEIAFSVRFEPDHQVVYLSRIVIARSYRGQTRHFLLLGILGFSWIEIRKQGYQHFCVAIVEKLLSLFQSIGMVVIPQGSPQDFVGEKRYACYVDMEQTAQALLKNQG